MDVGAEFSIPNPFGLLPSDFTYDMDGYRHALGFLSDLSSGVPEPHALEVNGGNPPDLVAWQRSDNFRRALSRSRAAGKIEMAAAEHAADLADELEDTPRSQHQRFVAFEDMPVRRSAFSRNPDRASWGDA